MMKNIHPLVLIWFLGFIGIGGAIMEFVINKPEGIGLNILAFIGLGVLIGLIVLKPGNPLIMTANKKRESLRNVRYTLFFLLILVGLAKGSIKIYIIFTIGIYILTVAMSLTYWILSKKSPLSWDDLS